MKRSEPTTVKAQKILEACHKGGQICDHWSCELARDYLVLKRENEALRKRKEAGE